jgi:CBS domain-containing protein
MHQLRDEEIPAMQSANTVREVMTKNPLSLPDTASLSQAARAMRDSHIGVVMVTDSSDKLAGLVTDRDIVVRAIAEGQDPNHVPLSRVLSKPEFKLEPDASIDQAIKMMSQASIRRLPVVEDGRCVGVVSLGDLAVARDPKSTLGRISSAPSNN